MHGGSSSSAKSDEAAAGASQQVRASVLQFLQFTTAHGLGRLSSQGGLLGRAAWAVFLLATYAGFGFHLYTLLARFYSSPVLTSMTASLEFEFPDVYLCPASAVSMSRLTHELSKDRELFYFEFCEHDCQLKTFKFDITTSNQPFYGVVEYFPPKSLLSSQAQAFSSVLETVEQSLVREFKTREYVNGSECRFTQLGSEYSGNVSRVPVYGVGNALVLPYPIPEQAPPVTPYITHRPCLPWNDAARRLLDSGSPALAALAGRLRTLGFSNGDARCRTPLGLPLSEFAAHASPPTVQQVGCYTVNTTDMEFNFICLISPIDQSLTYEICSECCRGENFTYTALQAKKCFCTNSYGRYGPSIGGCDTPFSQNSSQSCGSDTAAMVLKISQPKPLLIPTGSKFSSLMEGPYCFYEGAEGLSASYCSIPFCPLPHKYDCYVSSTDSDVQQKNLVLYSGRRNVTSSGRPCIPWNQLPREMMLEQHVFPALHIESTDGAQIDISGGHNFCRTVIVTVDEAPSQWTVHEEERVGKLSPVQRRQLRITFNFPGCFTAEPQIGFQRCDISQCDAEIPCVSGVIRDTVGSHLLASEFSNDLSTGLAECKFAGQECTEKDFENVIHPELGACHHLLNKRFLKDMPSTQMADAQLSIKYFTDTSDSNGRTFPNISKFARVVRSQSSSGSSELALRVIIVPRGVYPWSTGNIDVAPGQRVSVKLRFDRISRLHAKARRCTESPKPVTYRVLSWEQGGSVNSTQLAADAAATIAEGNWKKKLKMFRSMLLNRSSIRNLTFTDREFHHSDRHDCINNYKVQKFVENCSCLPQRLPIPSHFFKQYNYCFNHTDTSAMHQANQCFRRQLSLMSQYQAEAVKECQPACDTRGYSFRQVSYPWPQLNRDRSLEFLEGLAKKYGYQHNISRVRGVASIYYSYLRVLGASNSTPNSVEKDDLRLDRELLALQDRLAQVTVEAWTPYGQEIVEEEAYPAKNLMADVGGALGLWSGISILTVCEFLELLVHIGLALKVTCARRRRAAGASGRQAVAVMADRTSDNAL